MVKVVHSMPSATHIADKFLTTEKNVFSPAIRFPVTKASEWDEDRRFHAAWLAAL